jgi:phosphatidyl-myo-inositol alpha-mannosyltransferase
VKKIPHDLWVESFTPPFSTSLVPKFTSRPVIGLVQMLSGEDMSKRYKLPFVAVQRWGLRHYRHFIVLSDFGGCKIRSIQPEAACVRVPNGVDLPEELPPFGSGDYILFLGRVDVGQKGLDLLLKALDLAQPTLPLVIAGSGVPAQERLLSKLVQRTKGPVVRVGYVSGERKRALLAGAAFVVMPSRYETFGLSALEGMSFGKPVVHFELPRLSWVAPGSAISVPAYDVVALARALHGLSSDCDLRARLGHNGRLFAQSVSWDIVGEHYARIVDDVLSGKSGEPAAQEKTEEREARGTAGVLQGQGE